MIAGRIREDVFVIDEARVLGDRARPHDATARMAFTVARAGCHRCTEHRVPAGLFDE
jgi:hypothetical protein